MLYATIDCVSRGMPATNIKVIVTNDIHGPYAYEAWTTMNSSQADIFVVLSLQNPSGCINLERDGVWRCLGRGDLGFMVRMSCACATGDTGANV